MGLHPHDLDALDDLDPTRHQRRAQAGDQLRILPSRDRTRFHHGDPAAKPRERVRHLQPDRAAAQDQQVLWPFRQAEHGRIGQERHLCQPGNRRHRGAAAGGHDNPPRGQPLPVHHHRIRGDKARLPAQDSGAEAAEAHLGIGRSNTVDDTLDMHLHRSPIDRRFGESHPEPAGLPPHHHRMRRRQHRLARHAAGVEAVAAHPVPLDQRDLDAELGGAGGDRQAGGAGADDNQVEVRHGTAGATAAAARTARPAPPAVPGRARRR